MKTSEGDSEVSDEAHCSDAGHGAAGLAAGPGPGHIRCCRSAAAGGGQGAWQLRRSSLQIYRGPLEVRVSTLRLMLHRAGILQVTGENLFQELYLILKLRLYSLTNVSHNIIFYVF